ncbi:30S ribosomal protein S17 [bacterium]
MGENEKKKKVIIGKVVSDKMDKSRVVLIKRTLRHPLYEKVIRRQSKFMVHDEKNESKIGDTVAIVHVRPLSKRKSWNLMNIVEKAKVQ